MSEKGPVGDLEKVFQAKTVVSLSKARFLCLKRALFFEVVEAQCF